MKPRMAAALVALALVLLATAVATNRSFQVDEVEHIHSAYHIADGRTPYADFWEGHPPSVWYTIRPVVSADDPIGSFERSRWVLLIILLGHFGVVAYCAHRLAGPLAGLLAAGTVGVHSTMVDRGIEVRPDGPTSLLVTGALALELSPLPRQRRFVLQGVLLGIACTFSQKVVFACLAFGVLWLFWAVRERRPLLVVAPMLGWAVPLGVMVGLMALAGNLDDFWELTVLASARTAGRGEDWMQTFGPLTHVLVEGQWNLLFLLSAVVVLPLSAWRARLEPRLRFPTALAWTLVIALWLNPFPFPYLHVTVIPAVGILLGVAVARAIERRTPPAHHWGLALAWIALAALFSVPRLWDQVRRGQDFQLDTLREVQRITDPDDTVWDLTGFYFRPDAYPVFVMTAHMVSRYFHGGFPSIPDALREAGTPVIMHNYRLVWFEESRDLHERAEELISFVEDHYVPYKGQPHDPGHVVGTGRRTDLRGPALG